MLILNYHFIYNIDLEIVDTELSDTLPASSLLQKGLQKITKGLDHHADDLRARQLE